MKVFYTVLLAFVSLFASSQECAGNRYIQASFDVVVNKDIVYAVKRKTNGQSVDLKYDVYEPQGDTLSLRPAILLIHGGAFIDINDQNSSDIVRMCRYFTSRGYVCASLTYRQEPNILSFSSDLNLIKAMLNALVDVRDGIDHLVNTVGQGNPYRIDTARIFIGGVSAGAITSLYFSYLDNVDQMPPKYRQSLWNVIGDSADHYLRHRFDRVKPKATISISGAVLDTSWIVDNGIDLFLNHGSKDIIVPYRNGYPFGLFFLPAMYGSKTIYPRAQQQGIRVLFEDWIGEGHVPFMNDNFSWINPVYFDSTMRNIARFIYPRLHCDAVISGIKQHHLGNLNLYPNPNRGDFTLQLPKGNAEWRLQVYSTTGQLMLDRLLPQGAEMISVNEGLPAGMYYAKLSSERGSVIDYYAGAFAVAK